MIDLKNCPFCGTKAVSSVFSVDVYNWYEEKACCENCRCIISHPQAIQIWNTRPAEDAKDKEIERLKNDLEIQKNLTRMACFESNRAYDEVEKWKKMFYDLIDKQSNVATDPKVIIVGTDTNVPANAPDTGKMEEK
jgi:hypothetical protein